MEPTVLRLVLVVAGLTVLAAASWWWQRRDGRVQAPASPADVRVAAEHLAAAGLDLTGADAGAVLLSSATCAPCVHVERVLTDLAAERPGFRWVKVDAADHLDLAREHRILRVPTLLVVDADRRLLARAAGVPARADLAAALDGGAVTSAAAAG